MIGNCSRAAAESPETLATAAAQQMRHQCVRVVPAVSVQQPQAAASPCSLERSSCC